jgi:hypothetical protein
MAFSFRLTMTSSPVELTYAAFSALTHVAWHRYLTDLEGAELRHALGMKGPTVDRAWKLETARRAFRIVATTFPEGVPMRAELERYAEEAIPVVVDGGRVPDILLN